MNILEKVGPNEKLHCSVVSLSLTGRAKESLSQHVFSSYKEVTYGNAFADRYLGLHWPREPDVVGTLTFLSDEAS
jgi:hypothetical protein